MVRIGLVAVLLAAGPAAAQGVPQKLQNQGRLYNASQNPVNGSHTLVFALYSAASGGIPLWSSTEQLTVTDGYYAATLDGSGSNPFPVGMWNGAEAFLGITVDQDAEMTPRQPIDSVPYALDAVPTGAMMDFAGSAAPPGWLLCDGSAVSRTTYPALFTVLGTTYGAGDGSTTFNVPDLRGRVAVAVDANQVNTTGITATGQTGGEQFHTLTIAEMPAHSHPVTDPGHTHGVTDPGHTHAVTDPGHSHGVNDPGHSHSITDPGHSHSLNDPGHSHNTTFNYVASGDPGGALAGLGSGGSFGRTGQDSTMSNVQTGITENPAFTGITGDNTATTGITLQSSATGISLGSATTGIGVQSATTGVSVGSAGGGTAHNLMPPYVVTQKIIKY